MIQRVRGTRDLLPPETRVWAAVEAEARRVFAGFGYGEARLPLLEPTELFARTVGEETDIVAKEMYTFPDRKGRSLSLRPEGTASVARAFLENGLGSSPQPVRLFYAGPMFRYEKMQRGRYRQFSQLGIELLGAATPAADAEVLLALHAFLTALGFDDLVITLNNLGDPEDRPRFVESLKSELAGVRSELCADCQRRWETNPLRILDCKVDRERVAATTPIAELASEDAQAHVDEVRSIVSGLGVEVRWAPRLVRGLDYYMRTVFEVVSPALGEDTVLCGGGRYDRLISDLGGPEVPGIGFAIGEDRLVEVLPAAFAERASERRPVALLPVADGSTTLALRLARELVDAGAEAEVEVTGRSLRAGLKWASKIGARIAVILGGDELERGAVGFRDLDRGAQEEVPLAEVASRVATVSARSPEAGGE